MNEKTAKRIRRGALKALQTESADLFSLVMEMNGATVKQAKRALRLAQKKLNKKKPVAS